MGFSEFLTLILGLLQFPKALLQVIQVLQKTPSQKHDELIKLIEAESKAFEETGRPKWD